MTGYVWIGILVGAITGFVGGKNRWPLSKMLFVNTVGCIAWTLAYVILMGGL